MVSGFINILNSETIALTVVCGEFHVGADDILKLCDNTGVWASNGKGLFALSMTVCENDNAAVA